MQIEHVTEHVTEGFRIRNIARSIEARQTMERARVRQRIAIVLAFTPSADATSSCFTTEERAWFRRPLSSNDHTFFGL